MTLQALAERTIVSLSHLSDIERGRRLPSLEALDSIARGLNCLAVDLLRDVYPWARAEPAPRRGGTSRATSHVDDAV